MATFGGVFIISRILGAQKRCKPILLIYTLVAEKEGFEPPVRCRTTVFKTAAFDHSAISPRAKIQRNSDSEKNNPQRSFDCSPYCLYNREQCLRNVRWCAVVSTVHG